MDESAAAQPDRAAVEGDELLSLPGFWYGRDFALKAAHDKLSGSAEPLDQKLRVVGPLGTPAERLNQV